MGGLGYRHQDAPAVRVHYDKPVLTTRQYDVLNAYRKWYRWWGRDRAPRLVDIARIVGCSAPTVLYHRNKLMEMGFLARDPERSRFVRLGEGVRP